MHYKSLITGGASAIVLASLAAGAATAQDFDFGDQDITTVSGLVITAQKREQNVQDVPAAVTIVGQQLIEDAGVQDIKDLTILTPGLIVTSTSNETVTTARIRGVGTVGDNPGLESSVSVVIDGVYRPRNGVGFGDLGEIERVEVLKGPQGTLFGKNTSAGVIHVITQEPRFRFESISEVTASNYDGLRFEQSITGPIVEDVLAGRLFIATSQRDGFYDVTPTGPNTATEDATQDYWTARGQLLWFPSDTATIKVIADYTDRSELCCAAVQTTSSAAAGAVNFLAAGNGVLNPPSPFMRQAFANRGTEQEIEDMGLSVEGTWDTMWFGGSEFTSITAVRNWSTVNAQDSDFSGADLLYRPLGSYGREFDQLSQEFRLNGSTDRLNWLVGFFYADEDLHSDEGIRYGTQLESYINLLLNPTLSPTGPSLSNFTSLPAGTNFPAGVGQQDIFDQSSTSWALFTNNSYDLTDALELTIGLRYTSEEKDLRAQYNNIGNADACAALLAREPVNAALFGGDTTPPFDDPTAQAAGRASDGYALTYGYVCSPGNTPAFGNVDTMQSRDEDQVTGTIRLAYDVHDDLMIYGSYSRGYKAGGFNLDRARAGNTVTGYTVDPDTSFPEETADSFEIGFKSTINDQLLFNATAFHQTYEGFQLNTFTGISFIVDSIPEVVSKGVDVDVVWFTPIMGLDLQGGLTYADTKYGNFTPGPGVSPNLPNNRMSFAPYLTVSGSASYERQVSDNLLFRGSVNARYLSDYNTGSDLNPLKQQDAFTIVNARLSLGAVDENWEVELWGQNIFDEDYYQVVFDATFQPGGTNAFLGAPATYGVTLRKRFGD